MIEAMACGTPVIAWRCGSVPEVVEDGVTGFIVDDLERRPSTRSRRVLRLPRARVRAQLRASGSPPRPWPAATCSCIWQLARDSRAALLDGEAA